MKAKKDQSVDKDEDAKVEKPAGSGNAQADGMAQAHMYAALNYQQKQAQYTQQFSQLSQMNPLLFQQQMIQNMQYRQPTYQNYNNNRQNFNKQKPAEEKKDSNSGAGSTNLSAGGTQYDEAQLQQQLTFIKKLQDECKGGNPDEKPKEV